MTTLTLGLLLLVRTFDWFGVPPLELDTAQRVADAILQRAGVHVAWLVCPPAAGAWLPAPPCADAPQPNEVLVRIASSARVVGVDERVLGNAYVDAGAGSGSLATVYVDRIQAAAARAGLGAGTVLGRAMAHEIGHLLLGHGRHRDRGVMRAHWSDTVLRSGLAGDWAFLRDDARRMARNLAVRGRGRELGTTGPGQD